MNKIFDIEYTRVLDDFGNNCHTLKLENNLSLVLVPLSIQLNSSGSRFQILFQERLK